MTPIDKAIKALERIRDYDDPTGDDAWHNTRRQLIAEDALSDLSSLKLEDGDVAWLAAQRRGASWGHSPGHDFHNARIDRLLAFLGHGASDV